jgi:hypothetical protein
MRRLSEVDSIPDLPPSTRARFDAIHEWSTNSKDKLVHLLTTERRWLRLRNCVLGDIQEGLGSAYYHLSNVEVVEARLLDCLRAAFRRIPPALFPNGFMIGVNPRRMTCEYQAFVLVIRRTLEYFAQSVGIFFKCDVSGIRHLVTNSQLRRAEPASIREPVLSSIEKGLRKLTSVVPGSESRSVRDRIAHWEHVAAGGCIAYYAPDGTVDIGIAGGGENLNPTFFSPKRDRNPVKLTTVLKGQFTGVEELIFDAYSEIMRGV